MSDVANLVCSVKNEVSVMSEVDISEELPNGDEDSAFAEESVPNEEAHGQSVEDTSSVTLSSHGDVTDEQVPVFVTTSQGLLTPEQLQEVHAGLKTTHIVIHEQSFNEAALTVPSDHCESGLKTPTTPLPPPTPATPLGKEKGFKYNWDESVHSDPLPVRCKLKNGELHKDRFGSGGRGKCIKSDDLWYTPNEFEAFSGRASSKDWKRSIRYGGRTLMCLIEDGILHPHATSCTCCSCCDDISVTGPIRLFVPYKRQRRPDGDGGPLSPGQKKVRSMLVAARASSNVAGGSLSTPKENQVMTVSLANPNVIHQQSNAAAVAAAAISQPLTVATTENGEHVQIVTTDSAGNLVTGEAIVMTPLPQTAKQFPMTITVNMDMNEQRQWWQLEEMANTLLQQAHSLKVMIEQAKQQSCSLREAQLQQLKLQIDKEKNEAINAARIEAQMTLSRAIMEERSQKDIAVQQALAQARNDMQEKIGHVTVVTDDKSNTYSVSWSHPTAQNNIDSIMVGEDEAEEMEKEKE